MRSIIVSHEVCQILQLTLLPYLSLTSLMKTSYYAINGITLYRLLAAPVLIVLALLQCIDWFKWLLALSFFTDLIDGTLSRRFKVSSVFGARLDSIADDLTILAAITGLFIMKREFMYEHLFSFLLLFLLFLVQNIFAFIRYKRTTSFHTYLAKAAAILQGCFLILIFLLPHPLRGLFYTAVVVTAIELVEEIVLVLILSKWKTDVKGLYWVLKEK